MVHYSWARKLTRNWFWRTLCCKFPRIFTNFVNIFSGFSTELVTRNSLELVTRNSLDRTLFLGKGYEKFLEIAVNIFTGFSCERFLGISNDFLQNCYLGLFARFPTSKESSCRFSFCKQKLKTITTCPIMDIIKVAIINIREEQQQVLQGFCSEIHLF